MHGHVLDAHLGAVEVRRALWPARGQQVKAQLNALREAVVKLRRQSIDMHRCLLTRIAGRMRAGEHVVVVHVDAGLPGRAQVISIDLDLLYRGQAQGACKQWDADCSVASDRQWTSAMFMSKDEGLNIITAGKPGGVLGVQRLQ